MAQPPQGYQRQVGVSAPVSVSPARPEDFGAQIGQAVEQAGAVLEAQTKEAKRVRDNEELAAAGLAQQQHLLDTDQYFQDLRDGKVEGLPASGAGIEKSLIDRYDEGVQAIAGTFKSEEGRTRYLENAANYRRSYANNAFTTEAAKRSAYFANQHDQTATLAANRARGSDDPDTMFEALRDVGEMASGYGLPDDQAHKLVQYSDAKIKKAWLEGQAERHPERIPALLDSGRFNDLDTDLIDGIGDEARNAIRIRDAQIAAQKEANRRALRQDNAKRQAELETGAGTPKDWGDLAAQQEAAGDTDGAVRSRAKGAQMQAALSYRSYTLPQMDARLSELSGKQAKGALTPLEASERTGLQELRQQSAARLAEPGGALKQYLFATARALPALDVNDPATFAARGKVAMTAAAMYGRETTEPFVDAEADPLRDLVAGNPGDRLKALQLIGQFGDARLIEGAARQVTSPDDGGFRIAATLVGLPNGAGRIAARDVLRGADALKGNPKLYLKASADIEYDAYIGDALRGLPGYAADVREGGKLIAATRGTAQGESQMSRQTMRLALHAALGGEVRNGVLYGGIAETRGHKVMIPTGWTANGVFQRIARITGEDLGKAKVGGEGVWPDGSKLYTGQLRQLIPTYAGGTRYTFRDPRTGNTLQTKDGEAFVLDMAKVGWR